MTKTVGIDLGTGFSCISILDGKEPSILESSPLTVSIQQPSDSTYSLEIAVNTLPDASLKALLSLKLAGLLSVVVYLIIEFAICYLICFNCDASTFTVYVNSFLP